MSNSRRRPPAWALGLGLALVTGLVAPSGAQDTDTTRPEADAIARLDFPSALNALGAAIEADPTAGAPRLARAELHLRMQRPALALADLDALLAVDPTHVAALLARARIWRTQQAWNRARGDLDAALAAAPDNLAARIARAEVNESSGRIPAARADYDAALALAPDDAAVAAARAALKTTRAEARAAEIVFAPEAVMAEAFLVTEGAEAAPDTLHFVHAAPDLAQDYAGLDRAALDRAVRTGALRIVHMFTYTGRDASIWGNLALICAGAEALSPTQAALSDTPGQAALVAAENGDFAPLESLLKGVYTQAGLDPQAVQACALDRARATRYLADWQARRDASLWRKVNLLDHWPVWVLNGASVGSEALTARLAEIAPAPEATRIGADAGTSPNASDAAAAGDDAAPTETAAEPTATAPAAATGGAPVDPADAAEGSPSAAQTNPGDGLVVGAEAGAAAEADSPATVADPGDAAPSATATADPVEQPAGDTTAEADPVALPTADGVPGDPVAEAQPDDTSDGPKPPTVEFPTRPEPADDARVPVELRGVYAPTLAACLSYLDAIDAPARIDAVLPAMNPLDGPVLGTILVTSRRVYLFNPLDTECAIASAGADGAGGWQGTFACASPLAANAGTTMRLTPAAADGTAPRISADIGGGAPMILRQCRALGQLGQAFAPLWTRAGRGCSVAVPVGPGQFTFSVDSADMLILRVAPASIPSGAGTDLLLSVIDGKRLAETGGRWDGTGWQISLGEFDAAAERLGWGMFLDVRSTSATFEARLPLFGSSAAMKTLAACTPGRD